MFEFTTDMNKIEKLNSFYREENDFIRSAIDKMNSTAVIETESGVDKTDFKTRLMLSSEIFNRLRD